MTKAIIHACAVAAAAFLSIADADQLHGVAYPSEVSSTNGERKLKGNFTPCSNCPGDWACIQHDWGRRDYPHHYICECPCDGSTTECRDECTKDIEKFGCLKDSEKCCPDLEGVVYTFNQLAPRDYDCLSPEAV